MNLYLGYYESANYAGYGQHFVASAFSADEAAVLMEPAADEFFREQDSDPLEEDGIEEGPFCSEVRIELFNAEHDDWKFYQDPSQAQFYIEVNV